MKRKTLPTAISLFSGAGGLDIAFAMCGFNIKAHVEIDDYCRDIE